MLLWAAGCGGDSDSGVINPDRAALVHDTFSNGINRDATDCSSSRAIEPVSPSGQLYACHPYIVQFEFSGSSTTSGTYEQRTGFTQTALSDTVVESGTWSLVGGLLTCTANGNGLSASGLLDAPSGLPFPGYTRTIKIRFSAGPYSGQTVSYFNTENSV